MSKAPTLREFQSRFPTEDSCLDHLMRTRYGERLTCDKCGKDARFYRIKARRAYACEFCAFQIYPTAGTPFDRTRTPLRDWFFVMFQFCTSRNGVAAKEVQRQIGVTYKTAWRMCHEIRKYMGAVDGADPIGGAGEIVEIDETIVGGVLSGQGTGKGAYMQNKTYVLGMVEKGGDVVTAVIQDVKRSTIWPEIEKHVLPGAIVHTDELRTYRSLSLRGYRHQTVNHAQGEYVSLQGTTVNTIEGFWSMLKRGLNGTYIRVSPKHLPKYLAEFEYRYNRRQMPHLMLDQLLASFPR